MEDIGIQNNTNMSKINKMLDKTENIYIFHLMKIKMYWLRLMAMKMI